MMNFQGIIDKVANFIVFGAILGFLAIIYLFGSVMGLSTIAVLLGTVGLYYNYNQERSLFLPEGEEIIFKSTGNSHLLFVSIGEQDFPMRPVRVDLYLTNIGVLAEPPNSGETILYVPHYRISEFIPYKDNGLRIRYFDINDQFAEVQIFLKDRDAWADKHLKILAGISQTG